MNEIPMEVMLEIHEAYPVLPDAKFFYVNADEVPDNKIKLWKETLKFFPLKKNPEYSVAFSVETNCFYVKRG